MKGSSFQALSNVQFLLNESGLVAGRLLQGDSWPLMRTEARAGQLFDQARPSSQTTILTVLKARLGHQPPEVLTLLHTGSKETRQVINLALTLQQRRILRTFVADVLVPRVRAFDRLVTDVDVRRFLGHLAEQEPEVAAWSEETTQKTRSNITRLLQDAGILQASGRGRYVVLPQYLAPQVRSMLEDLAPDILRLLEALQ